MLKRTGIFLVVPTLVATLLLSHTPVARSAVNPNLPSKPSIGFSSSERLSEIRSESFITGYSYAEGATSGLYTRTEQCLDITDEKCKNSDSIAINAILPPCELGVSDTCVESLTLIDSSGKSVKATFAKEVETKKYQSNSKFSTPYGGSISVWKAEGVANSLGTQEYAVKVHIDLQNFDNRECGLDPAKCPFKLGNFSASVSPVKVQPIDNTLNCLWTTGNECGQVGKFPEGVRVGLSVRITNNLTGFMFGRMQDVTMEVTPFSPTINTVRVEADPVNVSSIYAFVEKSSLAQNPDIEKYWKQRRANLAAQDLQSPDTVDLGPWPQYAMDDFLAFEKFVKSGPSVQSIWKFGTGLGQAIGSPCFNDKSKLLGLVTTNASTFSPFPPIFDGANLNYKVGGAHHLEDGITLTKGVYDLALRTDFARCLYGFSNAPIKAAVSISYGQEGAQNVATEIVRQDKAKEWIYVSAKNFTFSAPTIKVRFTQEKVATEAPARKISITCVKGKTTKKVTGVAPKCPKGFKKK
jgi:hypothetical protein